MKQRNNFLDAAKGLCMLIIMCCHMGVDLHEPMLHTVQTTNDVALSSWMVFGITLIVCCATASFVDKYIPIIVGKTKYNENS